MKRLLERRRQAGQVRALASMRREEAAFALVTAQQRHDRYQAATVQAEDDAHAAHADWLAHLSGDRPDLSLLALFSSAVTRREGAVEAARLDEAIDARRLTSARDLANERSAADEVAGELEGSATHRLRSKQEAASQQRIEDMFLRRAAR
jgi:hypothetical protein